MVTLKFSINTAINYTAGYSQLIINQMFKILLSKIGLVKKYEVEYNSLITNSENKIIDYYDYSFIPEWALKERCLKWLKGKILTCVSNIVYIEKIGTLSIKKQCIF